MMSAKNTINKNQEKSNSSPISINTFFLLSVLALVIITTTIYFKSLNNQFTNWDDNKYITENTNIKTLHGDSLNYTFKKIISSYEQGNYHPLTMLSYCIEYSKYKLNPKPYHITNLILHLFNTLLVFCFIWLLTQQRWVAFITALLFAIHPMHVESVAWMAERKDVLYSFFYLAALCSYICYLQKESKKGLFYALTFLLFIFAVLSKAMAVSLPIAFLVIDYFLDRKITRKNVLEKLPFIVLAIIFGYVAIEAQKSSNAIGNIANYNVFDRILFCSYGLMTYLWKLIAPINLSCFYEYPVKINGLYPVIFYTPPLIILLLAFLVYRLQHFRKDLIFGFGFFSITIVLVLQILPIGGAIIADRYTYLPYIGLFFIIARGINNLLENKSEKFQSLKISLITAFVLFVMMFCYLSFQRSKVWHDSITLWTDAIQKIDDENLYDDKALYFNFRGSAYDHEKEYDKAIQDYSRAIQFQHDYSPAYYNRGLVYNNLGKYNEAILDYTSAIHYNPKYAKAYYNRGNAYFDLKNYDKAILDYSLAIKYNSTFAMAYNNRGNTYGNLGKFDVAIKDFTSAIHYNRTLARAYSNRAKAYFILQKFQPALEDAFTAKQLGDTVNPHFIEAIQKSIRSTNTNN